MNPEKIGKYEIVRLIGQGSAGKVFKAFDPVIDRFVALKIIHSANLGRDDALQRFKKEVRTQGRVLHPNVAVIFDVDIFEGQYIIVMEYVHGRSLREILKKEKILTFRQFFQVTNQICSGLACAHRHGVVHRDIKPENIYLSEEGQVKIIDFSIAKLESSPTMPHGSFLLGTAFYMAPEQIMGSPVGPAADQFSLGVICYEMLAGRRPFESPTLADSLLNIMQKEPPKIYETNPMADEPLDIVIRKTLAKDPAQRYPSLLHFRKGLYAYFNSIDPSLVEEDLF